MRPSDRLQKIEKKYVQIVEDILVLQVTDEILKLILKLRGETTLRVLERWKEDKLVRYSYYWLDSENNLIIGWDNAPHHKIFLIIHTTNIWAQHKKLLTQKNAV